jgi:hypothetical protein
LPSSGTTLKASVSAWTLCSTLRRAASPSLTSWSTSSDSGPTCAASSSMPFCPAPPAAWKLVATIARRPNWSCSALSGSIATIVVQLGLATIPRWSASASALTSVTTSGTSSLHPPRRRVVDDDGALGDEPRRPLARRPPPALNSARSKPPIVSSAEHAHGRVGALERRPSERSEANGTTSSAAGRGGAGRRA